jgi:hypothetical protein
VRQILSTVAVSHLSGAPMTQTAQTIAAVDVTIMRMNLVMHGLHGSLPRSGMMVTIHSSEPAPRPASESRAGWHSTEFMIDSMR